MSDLEDTEFSKYDINIPELELDAPIFGLEPPEYIDVPAYFSWEWSNIEGDWLLQFVDSYEGPIDLPKGITNCAEMFTNAKIKSGCYLRNFDTCKVTSVREMFCGAKIPDSFIQKSSKLVINVDSCKTENCFYEAEFDDLPVFFRIKSKTLAVYALQDKVAETFKGALVAGKSVTLFKSNCEEYDIPIFYGEDREELARDERQYAERLLQMPDEVPVWNYEDEGNHRYVGCDERDAFKKAATALLLVRDDAYVLLDGINKQIANQEFGENKYCFVLDVLRKLNMPKDLFAWCSSMYECWVTYVQFINQSIGGFVRLEILNMMYGSRCVEGLMSGDVSNAVRISLEEVQEPEVASSWLACIQRGLDDIDRRFCALVKRVPIRVIRGMSGENILDYVACTTGEDWIRSLPVIPLDFYCGSIDRKDSFYSQSVYAMLMYIEFARALLCIDDKGEFVDAMSMSRGGVSCGQEISFRF